MKLALSVSIATERALLANMSNPQSQWESTLSRTNLTKLMNAGSLRNSVLEAAQSSAAAEVLVCSVRLARKAST